MNNLPDRFKSFQFLGDASTYVAKLTGIVDKIELLDHFTQADLMALGCYMSVYQVKAGQDVIMEGEIGEFMLLVIDGTMDIMKRDPQGHQVQISEVGAGKSLGEMSVIDGGPRFASCVAKTNAMVAVLNRAQLLVLIDADPKVGVKLLMHLLQLLNQRLRNVSNRLMEAINVNKTSVV